MPVYRQGYRRWKGELSGRAWRWLAITRAGVALTGRSRWLRRFVLVAWLPLLYYALVFFMVGQATELKNVQKLEGDVRFEVMNEMFGGQLTDRFIADPAAFRPVIWSVLMHLFLRYTQVFSVMIVVAIVGPRLVSEDLRSRSLALYFSKPIGRLDYIVGKLGVVAFWVATVSFLPCLALYGLSIAFSPSLETLSQTWHLLPRLLLYSLILVIGTGAPMLALSALTPNPRFLGFAWAAAWVMSSLASTILHFALYPPAGRGAPPAPPGEDWTGLVSFSANFHAVSFHLFEIGPQMVPVAAINLEADRWVRRLAYDHEWTSSLALIAASAVVSLAIVAWRVGRPGEAGAR